MRLSHLDFLFWAFGLLGHLLLLGVLLLRRRASTLPLFTAFILANVLKSVVLYLIYPGRASSGYSYTYFYTYWSFGILDVCLQLAVTYEIASRVFKPLGSWATDVRRGLLWLIVISVCAAYGLAWLCSPATHRWREALVVRGSLFSASLLAELFVGMVALSVTAGLPWKSHVARISQGLGVYSIFCIAFEAGNSYFGLANGTVVSTVLTRARMALYLICLIYWIVTLSYDEPDPRPLPEEVRRKLAILRSQTAANVERLKGRKIE